MSVTHPAPVRCVNVRIILNQVDLRAPDTFIRQQCSSGGAAGKAHLLLDCDPQILQEMEPISDLTRLRRTLASSLCVQPASVSAHDLDRRMLLQPSRDTRHAPVLKDIDNRTALQVDDHRAVAPRSPPAPIIYANDPDRGVAMSARGIPLQLPQDRVVANRHPEPSHQALAGSAAGAMAEQTDNLGDPPCPACIRGSNRWQSVGECLSFTFLMRAPPAAQPKLHRYGLALDRQILKASVGPAMPISGAPSAIGANAGGWSGSGNNPTIIICERDTQNFCPRAGRPFRF
ncbi:hypothetical protein FB001_121124 [Ensifer sp. SEMIA 135]|nr:hypothetical protein FB000_1247 [Ensifer sp. SEMIA 134]TWB30148.1 hypothetical protein FB001_121124 [Ensifer sp. SEMIA 135]